MKGEGRGQSEKFLHCKFTTVLQERYLYLLTLATVYFREYPITSFIQLVYFRFRYIKTEKFFVLSVYRHRLAVDARPYVSKCTHFPHLSFIPCSRVDFCLSCTNECTRTSRELVAYEYSHLHTYSRIHTHNIYIPYYTNKHIPLIRTDHIQSCSQ